MTSEEALDAAETMNRIGIFRSEWFYYPCHHSKNGWFVGRRLKKDYPVVAIYSNGIMAPREAKGNATVNQ